MLKKSFLFWLVLAVFNIFAFGNVNRISELDALRRLPFEVKENGKNTVVPEFVSRATEYAVVVSSMPEELKELRKAGAETGNSWKLFVTAKDGEEEKVIVRTLASTFHYYDKESKQANSFVLVGEQKLVALITKSEDIAKLAKYEEKRFFLLCHDGGHIFYPRAALGMVWESREANDVDQENFQPKGAVFKDEENGVRYVKKNSETDKKIEKLIYLVAGSAELGYRGTVLTKEGYERAEKTFWEKAGGALKKEVIGAIPFVSFGLRYGNFAVSNLIKSSSLNVASSFVGGRGQQRTTGLNIYCDNQIAQEVFYRNMVGLRKANSVTAQETNVLKQKTESQSEQLAQKQKKIEELETQISLMGSALAEQQRQSQEREFALTQVLRVTRDDAEKIQKESNGLKERLVEESLKIAKLQKREIFQSVALANLKEAYSEIKNSTAFFEARLISLEQKREARDNFQVVSLKKEEREEARVKKAGFAKPINLGQILPASVFGILLIGMFCGNHNFRNKKFIRPIRREIKTKKPNKKQTKTKKEKTMNTKKNFSIALIFAFIFSFSALPLATAQTTDITSRVEVYTPKDSPELFNRLAKQHPELHVEVLESPRQVIMEEGGVFKPRILAPGVKVMADKDGNIKYAQCGNKVIDPGNGKSADEPKEPEKKEKEEPNIFLLKYFEQMKSFQEGQQALQAKQMEQQEKFLEFLSTSQRLQQQQVQRAQQLVQPRQPAKEKFIWWRDGVNLANLGLNIADLIVDVHNGGGKKSNDTILNLTQSLTNSNDSKSTSNPVVDVAATLSGGNNTANNITTAQGGNSASNSQGGNAQGGSSNSTSQGGNANAQGGNSVANANNDNKVSSNNTNTSNNLNSASNDNKNSNTGTNSNNNSNQQNQGQAQNQASTNNNTGGTAGSPNPPTPPPTPPDPVVNVGNNNTNNTHNSVNNSGNGNGSGNNRPPQPVPPPPPPALPPPPPPSN